MADKDASKSVMGNLPSTRPARIGGSRESRNGAAAKTQPKPRPKATAATAKPKPRPKATAATAKPKPAAAAKPKPAAASSPKPAATSKPTKPRAVRSGSPGLKAAKDKPAARRPAPATPPKGTELVTTAVQAAGELAQIGFTLGGQVVKRAVKRLPRR
jgi:outer membrane biosynthesis protein TonB